MIFTLLKIPMLIMVQEPLAISKKAYHLSETLAVVSKKLSAKNLRLLMVQLRASKKLLSAAVPAAILLADAINSGADAFVTADIKYHSFHSAKDKILLIDAGHYETEIHVIDEITEKII